MCLNHPVNNIPLQTVIYFILLDTSNRTFFKNIERFEPWMWDNKTHKPFSKNSLVWKLMEVNQLTEKTNINLEFTK